MIYWSLCAHCVSVNLCEQQQLWEFMSPLVPQNATRAPTTVPACSWAGFSTKLPRHLSKQKQKTKTHKSVQKTELHLRNENKPRYLGRGGDRCTQTNITLNVRLSVIQVMLSQ